MRSAAHVLELPPVGAVSLWQASDKTHPLSNVNGAFTTRVRLVSGISLLSIGTVLGRAPPPAGRLLFSWLLAVCDLPQVLRISRLLNFTFPIASTTVFGNVKDRKDNPGVTFFFELKYPQTMHRIAHNELLSL